MRAYIAWLLTICSLVCLCGCSGSQATESNATTVPDATTTGTLTTEKSSDTTTTTTTEVSTAGKKTTTNSKVTTTTTTTGTRSTTSTTTSTSLFTTTTTGTSTPVKTFDDFTYGKNTKEGYIAITGYVGTSADVVIPNMIEGLPVKFIGYNAFMSNDLQSVTIPNSVTDVCDYAFRNCQKLMTVKFGNGITYIGSYAFENCVSLKKIQLPPQLKEIGVSAFQRCESATEVFIPKTVSKIGMQAFFGAHSLTTLVLEDGIETLDADAVFWDCPSLKTLTIPASVKKLGSRVFPSKLETVTFMGDVPELDKRETPFGDSITDYKVITIYYPKNAKGWGDTPLSKYTLKPME